MSMVYNLNMSKKGIVSYCAKRNEQIWKFRQKGWTVAEIADRYQITEARVYQILGEKRKKGRSKAA
jgi:Mor family transcriptional regulator